MEVIIKNTFQTIFTNYKNIQKCKDTLKDTFKENKDNKGNKNVIQYNKNDHDQYSLINHMITKTFRILYQENLTVRIHNSTF